MPQWLNLQGWGDESNMDYHINQDNQILQCVWEFWRYGQIVTCQKRGKQKIKLLNATLSITEGKTEETQCANFVHVEYLWMIRSDVKKCISIFITVIVNSSI